MDDEQLNERILALWHSGHTSAAIAKLLAVSTLAIARVLIREERRISSNPNKKSRTTKAQLVDRIAGHSGQDREKLATLEKANHEALELVLEALISANPSGSLSF